MWTQDDTQYLIDNYAKMGATKCSAILNKSIGAVKNKASRLKIKSLVKKSAKDSYLTWISSSDFKLLEDFTTTSEPLLHRHTICGYEWRVRPNNIRKGQGCPGCGKSAKLSHEAYELRLADTEFTVMEPYEGSDIKILHKHKQCGYEWAVRPHDILRGQNCPRCSKNNYSKIAIDWLNSFDNPNIIHAENGGEYTIAGYKVDGYDPITNTAYEFHGDAYHGNLDIFEENDYCHPFNKNITAMELFHSTAIKMDKLSEVANVIYIWEKDYKERGQYVRLTQR